MTLSELCTRFREKGEFAEFYLSTFFHYYTGTVDYYIEEEDLKGLDKYSLCLVLSIYEYALNKDWVACCPAILKLYGKEYCIKEETYLYKCYKELEESVENIGFADKMFDYKMKNSLPEFRKHGIIADYFSYAV